MRRSIKYRKYSIKPHRFVTTWRFAEIFDPNGDLWDETAVHRTTLLAIDEAKRMIDHRLSTGVDNEHYGALAPGGGKQ